MKEVGIVGYGAYIPKYRIKVEEIARIWGGEVPQLGVNEKSVADIDEDTVTIGVEAAKNALKRAQINPNEITAIFVGSESHPYVVKPSGTTIAEAIGASQNLFCADLEFACKAGTAAMQICYAMIKAEMIRYGLAIGADCAQSRPGDALEFTAGSGGAAFILGDEKESLAKIEATTSFATDTPDFFRVEGEFYPKHAGRFTGEPAYFKHVIAATKNLFEATGFTPNDFDYVVFHMPNGKFPLKAAKELGIPKEKLEKSLEIVRNIGNTYSGSSLLGLCNVLDVAKPNERILLTSYGSGAGSDSFSIIVKEKIEEKRNLAPLTSYYLNRKEYIDYGIYVKLRRKLKL
ncbi:MAG: hydroxymethylglutaryl-CoA synthase [Candidatus Aenigmatarchaeota archaeon]